MFIAIVLQLKKVPGKHNNVNYIDPTTGLRYNRSPRKKKLYRSVKKSSLGCRGTLHIDWKGELKLPASKHSHHYSKKSEKKAKFVEALKKECVEKKGLTIRQVFDAVSLRYSNVHV